MCKLRTFVPGLALLRNGLLALSAGAVLSACTYVDDLRSRGVLPGILPHALDGTILSRAKPEPKQSQSLAVTENNTPQIHQYPGVADISEATNRLNQERLPRYLQAMNADHRLMQAAQNHANYMGQNGVFGHEFGPETKFQKRIYAVGFTNSAGENIGVGYKDLEAAMVGWMNSEGHRKNMLKPNYNLFGLAYARNNSGKNPQYDHFWVLIMGQAERTSDQVATILPKIE